MYTEQITANLIHTEHAYLDLVVVVGRLAAVDDVVRQSQASTIWSANSSVFCRCRSSRWLLQTLARRRLAANVLLYRLQMQRNWPRPT